MRVVQALYWLKDTLSSDADRVRSRIGKILIEPVHGCAIHDDLQNGFGALPAWMQDYLRTVPAFDPTPKQNDMRDTKSQPPLKPRRKSIPAKLPS